MGRFGISIVTLALFLGACSPHGGGDHSQAHEFITLAPICESDVLRQVDQIESGIAKEKNLFLTEDQQEGNLVQSLKACRDLKSTHPQLACRRANDAKNENLITIAALKQPCLQSQALLSVIGLHHLSGPHRALDYTPPAQPPKEAPQTSAEVTTPVSIPAPKPEAAAAAPAPVVIPPPEPPKPLLPPKKPSQPRYRKAIKASTEDYEIVVKDPSRLLNLIFDQRKFVIEGQIFDSRVVHSGDAELAFRTRCIGLNTESNFISAAQLNEKPLTVMTVTDKNEGFSGGVRRVLSITFNELGAGLVCVKPNPYDDFQWRNLQDALDDIVEIHPKAKPPPPPPKAKLIPVDDKGFCHFDLVREYRELEKALHNFDERLLALAMKEVYATTEPDRAAYRREIRQSAVHLMWQCYDFNVNWREFHCRPYTKDEKAALIHSADLKKICTNIRTKAP